MHDTCFWPSALFGTLEIDNLFSGRSSGGGGWGVGRIGNQIPSFQEKI